MAQYRRSRDGQLSHKPGLTLDNVKVFALANGCTVAQFARALESVGDNPLHVASYLSRHKFVTADFKYAQV